MLLVPRQLGTARIIHGVPYYGGRFSPAQAYAAAHPSHPVPGEPDDQRAHAQQALLHLLNTGVLTPEEYNEFSRRLNQPQGGA